MVANDVIGRQAGGGGGVYLIRRTAVAFVLCSFRYGRARYPG